MWLGARRLREGAKGPVFNFQQILEGTLESRVLMNTRVNSWF
jgi:hypothetical protein